MKKTNYYHIFIIFSLLLSNIALATVEPPKNPNSAKGCAICHYRWIDTFFIDGKGSDLVAYQSEKVVAAPEMCFSCHDGSVMDSRVRLNNGSGHKTSVPPPAGMKVPEIFPLDQDGNVQCATCHTAHGVPSGKGVETTIFMRTSNRNSAMCRMCHSGMDGGVAAGHHPLGVVQKGIPAKLLDLGAESGKTKNQLVCETCHTAHGSPYESFLTNSAENSALCLDCHSDKNTFTQDGKKTPNHIVNVTLEKVKGSKDLIKKGVKLGYKGVMTCQTCHRTHHNIKDSTSQLCLNCHPKGEIAETNNFKGNEHPLDVNPFEAKVAERTLKLVDVGEHSFALPLYNTFGRQVEKGKMTCSTCHNPHGSLADSEKINATQGVRDHKNRYLLRKQAPDICGECHRNKLSIANSKHDLMKVIPERKNLLKQTPAESGLCGSCHAVHGGWKGFLWSGEINKKDGRAPQGLCMSCHNEKGIAKKKAIRDQSHPLDISPSAKGLATTLPLFEKSGKISKAGVMTCSTCHDPHSWKPSKVMAEDHYDLERDSQNSFLRLENSPSPELCTNCHPDKAYIEKTDHDLTVTDPFSKNILGQTPDASGVCGVCHLVHYSKNQTILWARNFAAGDSIMEMMCNSCHSQNGSAKNKTPKISSHPKDKLIIAKRNITGRFDSFPIYHETSGKLLLAGNISCPSCHNTHQWNSKVNSKGKGVNVEGDATNSFLRSQALRMPCADCHGPDALLKLKYFHNPNKRTNDVFEAMLK